MLDHDEFVVAALVEEGLLGKPAAEEIARFAAEQNVRISKALVQRGLVTSRDLALVRATICECAFVDLDQFQIDVRNAALLPRGSAETMEAFPLFLTGDVATVGMVNPMDLRSVDQLRTLLKVEIDPVLCEAESLTRLIDRAYTMTGQFGASGAAASTATASAATEAEAAMGREPIVAAVNQILGSAVEKGASDVHINPDETALHIRFRIDGLLQGQQGPALAAHPGLVQRLKVMANLDLTQTRRPQDGKFRFVHRGRYVDLRLSIIPTVCGENVVMRLLTGSGHIKGFPELGMQPGEATAFEQLLDHPHGMVLVTGPTGSGKTTTLYTALKRLNTPERNIITIEDPVEVRMPMIRQVPVNAEIGMSFAGALRSVLRQDPDVVFVGEIRDEETARIAVQAALTGHLVLSSLHTNDAPGSIPRLRDLGCPGFAINAALLGVVAQRLVRRVCADCAKPFEPEAATLAQFGPEGVGAKFVQGTGCSRCMSTGYKGRVGIYELLKMTPAMHAAVNANAPVDVLRAAAVRAGVRLMWRDGLEKAKVGLTTPSEVLRVAAAVEVAAEAPTPMKVAA
ncbi:MAG: GspE/PulE family protein [Phycisphaerales bacterium]